MAEHSYSLRPLMEKDAPRMVEMMHDAQTTQYLQIGGPGYTRENALRFIAGTADETGSVHRAVVDSNGVYQGTISLKNLDMAKKEAEYAISMHPDAQGKGAARDATQSILHYAFHCLKLERVYLNVLDENQRAVRFYEKNGFIYRETTIASIHGIEKPLRWYDIKSRDFLGSNRRKLVFFYRKEHNIAGSLIVFLSLARRLSEDPRFDVYYLNFPNEQMEKTYAGPYVTCLDVDQCDYSQFSDAEFIVPMNYLPFLLERLEGKSCKKILLYSWHPDLARHMLAQFYDKNKDPEVLFGMFREHKALAFMDESCKTATEDFVQEPFDRCYVPVFSGAEICKTAPKKKLDPERLSIGWMSRLDADKINSLLNFLDNLQRAKLDHSVDVHIIGDGNCRNRIDISQYAPKIRFIFTSYLYGEQRDSYIRENVDLMVVMGISALDVAQLEVPVVIPMLHPTIFPENEFVYLFDTKEYSLGWDIDDFHKMNIKSYTIAQVIDHIRNQGRGEELGMQCAQYAKAHFDGAKSCQMLLEALDNCTMTMDVCMSNPVMEKHMSLFHRYKKLRNRDYEVFIAFVQKLNRINDRSAAGRAIGMAGVVCGPAVNKAKAFAGRATGAVKNRLNKKQHIARYNKVQASYEAKLPAIRKAYEENGKLKAIFFVIFSSVFPTKPIFERMLEDPAFDPYIMVTPDMQRSVDFKNETYQATFRELSEQYGDRVLHGYDVEDGFYIQPASDYQLAFFNNPYSKMAYKFHHVTYFENKNVLTLYVNYGFAAIKYGRTIMKTDFYNLLWKVCIDSEINRRDLAKHQPIKARNALVTGYLKMDRLAQAPVHDRTRKKIIICPHHTVFGWKALDISNFLRYYEFFAELPRMYPDIDFVFRPHPLLFPNLLEKGLWTQQQIDEYLAGMTASPNVVYDTSGDYFELFANSDAMIHDCSSFIGEYLFTGKPCCYMLKSMKDIKKVMNPMGVKCMKNYYKAFSQKDIVDFIDNVVVAGVDPMKEARERFSAEELKFNYPHATETVLDTIKTTLGIQ